MATPTYFYLTDSNGNNWQVGASQGAFTTRRVGAVSVVPLYVNDSAVVTWQLGITPLGQLTTTVVGAQSDSNISLVGFTGIVWSVGVTTLGQLTLTFSYTLSLSDAQGPSIDYFFS
jgi:hypothetical protein